MPILGYNTAGSNNLGSSGTLTACTFFQVTASASFSVNQISAYIGAYSGGTASVTFAIYADNGSNAPGTLLGTTVAGTSAAGGGWLTLGLGSSVAITNGNKYWLYIGCGAAYELLYDNVSGFIIGYTTATYVAGSAPASNPSFTALPADNNEEYSVYASLSAGLSAGTASAASTAEGVTLASTAATNGTTPYSYQWQRADATIGTFSNLSGVTGTSATDTTAVAGTAYEYQCVVTDSATPTPATATSNVVYASRKVRRLQLLAIGTSITYGYGEGAGQDPITQLKAYLSQEREWEVNAINQGQPGSTSAQWLSGASSNYLFTAMSAAQTAFGTPNPATNPVYVQVELGPNDAGAVNLVPASTFASNCASIFATLTAAGYTVVVHDMIFAPAGANSGAVNQTSVSLAAQYRAGNDALCNGTTIIRGAKGWPCGHYANHQADQLQADYVHPNVLGYEYLGIGWAGEFVRIMDGGQGCGPVPTTLTFTTNGTTPIPNATVWVTLDPAGLAPISAPLSTNSSGQAVFYLASGQTYYANLTASGYEIRNQSFTA